MEIIRPTTLEMALVSFNILMYFETYFDVFRNLLLFGSVSCKQLLLQVCRVFLLIQVLDAVLVFHLLDTQVMDLRQLTPLEVARRFVLPLQSRVGQRYLFSPTYDLLKTITITFIIHGKCYTHSLPTLQQTGSILCGNMVNVVN